MENVLIIGSGIAGLTAAIYTARANLKPLVIGGPEEGGQLTLTTDVENFPGFPDAVLGPKLVQDSRAQAEKFGTKFITGKIMKLSKAKDMFTAETEEGKKIQAKTVIVASGASARWLGIPSEQTYKGKGVHSCATCDGFFYRGKEIAIIGGGDAAMEESNFLTKFASKVTIIHRSEEFKASTIMLERAKKNPKIAWVVNKEVAEILGDGKQVTGLRLKDTKTGKLSDFKTDGLFLAIGHIPNTGFLKGFANLDELGYLKSDRWMHTSVEGLFAAGDVQDIKYRQAITAAGTGCMAAIEVERYLTHN
jgi:thioredoxin reductase (NADPH)